MRNNQPTLAAFARDVRSELRDSAREDLEGFEGLLQTKGYGWLGDRMAMMHASTSGSGVPITELMKTPSRTQTVRKTRTITTAAKDLTSKVTLANQKLLGSPINKSSSSRPPLSPLGGRNLNFNIAPLAPPASSPAKSQPSKSSTAKASTKSDKAKATGTAKRGRPKKVVNAENIVVDTETSTSTRSAGSQSTRSGDLLASKAAPKGKGTSEALRSPASSQRERAVMEPVEQQVKQPGITVEVDIVEDGDEPMDEQEEVLEEEVIAYTDAEADKAPTAAATASTSSRPRTVDLSVIAETEEDRSSISVTAKDMPSQKAVSAAPALPTQPAILPATDAHDPETVSDNESARIETSAVTPALIPTAPPVPARQVRSSWLSKALGAAVAPSSQRPSDGTDRPAIPPVSSRLSTSDFPTMRKSLAQPGILAKRKSGEGVLGSEEEIEEKRPEKLARVGPASAPVQAATTTAQVVAQMAAIATSTAGQSAVISTRPVVVRQQSQEVFPRPTSALSNPPPATTSAKTPSNAAEMPRERPASDIDRVNKALDDLRERQQAKEAAKQKAALTTSVAAASSATRPKTTTGAGFLRGLGSTLGRSLGIGGHGQAETNEEERRRHEEEEERKAQEELNEIMRKVDEPEVEVTARVEDVEMAEKPIKGPEPSLRPIVQDTVQAATEDELNTDEEAEVNESIDFDSIPMNLGSPEKPAEHQHAIPTHALPQLISTTPSRPARHQVQSTTPQGTPPRTRSALPATLHPSPAKVSVATHPAEKVISEQKAQSSVHDKIKLFNASSVPDNAPRTGQTSTASEATRTPFLFSPGRTGSRQSDAIDVDEEEPAVGPSAPAGKPVDQPQVLQDSENEADDETEEEEEEEEEKAERPTSSRQGSQAGSIFGQASIIANKALGVKPTVGQVKSVQLAGTAYKKDLAASERRAQIKEQRLKNLAERKAEEVEKQRLRDAEEKKLKLAEMEKRKKESEERKAAILKAKADKAEKERAEREAAEKAELEKRKLASSQTRPAPMQPAKRVISASTVVKMKEPAKLTKLGGPIPSAHGPSKLVPSTFRTAPAPPETPSHQMSQASTIRLVGQPQQPSQGDRKPLGPPTRPSAIRASHAVQAIRQSAAVASQHAHAQTSVLAQSRLALQSQLEAEAAEIASEDIVLPDIASEYSDSGDETDTSPAFKRPAWAESPELRAALAAQASKNPDELFGPIRPLMMEELFKAHKGKFRSRTSSGNWTRDGLKKEEEEEYARRMGFTTGTGQW